jgi:hypothetical protein
LQHLRPWVGYVDTASFHVLMLFWCVVAWRTVPEAAPIHRLPAATALAQPS